MNKDEALKLALEAFRQIDEAMPFPVAKLAQKAIKEALAQPEQEYKRGYADAMNWKVQNYLEHLPPKEPEQEPVAYSYTSRITGAQGFSHHPMPRFVDYGSWDVKPLYTTPPQRTWVGLTDEEQQAAYDTWQQKDDGWGSFYALIEAKLKEKNSA